MLGVYGKIYRLAFLLEIFSLLFPNNVFGGNPIGFIDLDSIPTKLSCTDKIVVLKEKKRKQYLVYPHVGDQSYTTEDVASGNAIFQKLQDNFDFIYYSPQSDSSGWSSEMENPSAKGIGQDPWLPAPGASARVKS